MEHNFKNLREVFDEYKIIHVPYYQRDYVWGLKNNGRNLYKFIDDIFSQYSENPQAEYFIGTLAFCSEKVNDVIDGQQRITSLILILSILADLKCSKSIKDENKKLLFYNNEFIIQEEFYLTEELKFNLGYNANYNSQNYSVNISKTKDRIISQINNAWGGYQTNWYDNLYNYILNKVVFISLEYSNIADSLKYFLNINSLSIQLTQSDIFYSILSQSLRISKSTYNIFSIKQRIADMAEFKGISKTIDVYKAYDPEGNVGTDNIVYIFLNSRYQNNRDISSLNETGIGKWMSFYNNIVFKDPFEAKKFVDDFIQYLNDFESIYKYFSNYDNNVIVESSLYTSWILLQYEGYFDILKFLIELFRIRHNYLDRSYTLYEDGLNKISLEKLDEVAKRLNLTLIWNYIRSCNKRLDGIIGNISLDKNGQYKRSIEDIKMDIDLDYMFNLNYNDKHQVSNVKIKDESRLIKVIFACQESLLNSVANPENDFNYYLRDILLTDNFSIEHIYSVNEYHDKNRLNNWRSKKNKFIDDVDFDTERFGFESLSLLDKSTNSSAGTDEIVSKLAKYKNAKKVCGNEWEYLIQSLVEYSEFYSNPNITKLNLPKRVLKNIDQNTWELSDNNREFNIELLKLALEEMANKGD